MQLHDKKLIFIGPMGSGKSSLARRAAAKYGGKVFDTDREFVRRYGAINDFFAGKGEAEFRRLEEELLIEAAKSDAAYVATGGGAVLSKRGMNAFRMSGDIAYLTAPMVVLEARIMRSDRPLKNKLVDVMKARAPLYEKYADYSIDSSVDSLSMLEAAVKHKRGNRYDIVLCDSDDTLLDFQKARSYSIRATVEKLRLPCSEEAADAAYKSVVCKVWKRLERGEITKSELETERFRMLGEMLGISLDIDAFNRVYIDEMRGTRFVRDGAIEFLNALRERGMRTYIITNSFINMAEKRLEPLRPYVDGEFVSEAVGYYKPDKKYFDAVLGEIGVTDKSRVIVFGDSETSDIAGGVNSGIDTCLYAPKAAETTAADYCVDSYTAFLNML
ncbi:MAG: HAD-IA family hydrolase [Clostridiales bacterium]|nr:HAD-IA family hydrolase [Clostridiales bacterium]